MQAVLSGRRGTAERDAYLEAPRWLASQAGPQAAQHGALSPVSAVGVLLCVSWGLELSLVSKGIEGPGAWASAARSREPSSSETKGVLISRDHRLTHIRDVHKHRGAHRGTTHCTRSLLRSAC